MRFKSGLLLFGIAVLSATPALAGLSAQEALPRPGFAGSFLVARAAEQRGDWQVAEAAFAAVAASDPSATEFLHRQSVLLLNQGRYNEALKLAGRISQSPEATHLAHLLLFTDAARHNDADAARLALNAISSDGLGQYIKPFFAAWLADGFEAAQEALRPVSEMPSLAEMVQLHTALLADRHHNVQAARQAFARLIGKTPSYRTVALAASFYARNQMPDKREALLQAAAQAGIEPSLLARLRARQDGDDQVTSLSDGVAETLFGLASLLQAEGANDVALPYLRIATALRPDFALANLMSGDLLLRLGRYAEAGALYEGQVAARDIGPLASLRLAALKSGLNGPLAARSYLNALIEKQPDWAQAWAQLGEAAVTEGDLTSAEAHYTKALALTPEADPVARAHLLFLRGMVNQRLRNSMAAEADLKASLALVPDNAERLNFLGYMWAERGVRLDEAEHLLTKAMALEPNNAFIVDSLGWLRFRAGQTTEAVRLLELAAELTPYNSVINDHLGDAYWAAGRLQEARFQWQRAIAYRDEDDHGLTSVEDLRLKIARGLSLQQTAGR